MRLQRHGAQLQLILRPCALRPVASSLYNRCRRYASSQAYPEKVAVLGGGISGLASAYYINKEFPQSNITIHEANKDSGGWIQSRRVQVPGGDVLFEYGPRTLRPGQDASITAQLIQDLKLTDNVIFTKKNAPGAKNRYIYYPDRTQRLPNPTDGFDIALIAQLWSSGLLAGVPNAFLEPFRPTRPDTLQDESIGSFIGRRLDKRLAQNLISAVMHGIYAGDVWKLSARTLFALLWQQEAYGGSIYKGMIKCQSESTDSPVPHSLYHPYDLEMFKTIREEVKLDEAFLANLNGSAMFTFENGMAELISTLKSSLEQNGQVDFKCDSWVRDYKLAPETPQQVQVTTGSKDSPSSETYDLVISSLRSPGLTPYVTVQTVNLYFPNPNLLRQKGFGYLIPQSVAFEQNPERALGVIFDSDAITGQDTVDGTKLTVMLGGHYWEGWEHFPSDEDAYEMAMSLLRRHLEIKEEPTHYNVNLSKDCIPQYTVGYEDRLRNYAYQVRDQFKGRVRIVGSQVGGVGVNDCIRGAWNMARGLRGVGWKGMGTGLERVLQDGPWVNAPSKQGLSPKKQQK